MFGGLEGQYTQYITRNTTFSEMLLCSYCWHYVFHHQHAPLEIQKKNTVVGLWCEVQSSLSIWLARVFLFCILFAWTFITSSSCSEVFKQTKPTICSRPSNTRWCKDLGLCVDLMTVNSNISQLFCCWTESFAWSLTWCKFHSAWVSWIWLHWALHQPS